MSLVNNIPINDMSLEELVGLDEEGLTSQQLLAIAKRLQALRQSAPTRRAEIKSSKARAAVPPPSKAILDLANI